MKNETNTLTKEQFTFFWGGEFSQWYPSIFTINNIVYKTAEHYMMWSKAMLFNDQEAAAKILSVNDPREVQTIGRSVKNFDKAVWESHCKQFVYDGSYAKFTQDPILLKVLMATGNSTMVEASPTDTIWGIGLDAEHPDAQDRTKWKGTNWLGEVLQKLREDLRSKNITSEIPTTNGQKPTISFEDYMKLDVRICQIISAEKVEKTDKLYKLEINTGFDIRVVVSAIAHIFKNPDDLLGKLYPFVLNLEPRKIKGIESTAMIILAENTKEKEVFGLDPCVIDYKTEDKKRINEIMKNYNTLSNLIVGSIVI